MQNAKMDNELRRTQQSIRKCELDLMEKVVDDLRMFVRASRTELSPSIADGDGMRDNVYDLMVLRDLECVM